MQSGDDVLDNPSRPHAGFGTRSQHQTWTVQGSLPRRFCMVQWRLGRRGAYEHTGARWQNRAHRSTTIRQNANQRHLKTGSNCAYGFPSCRLALPLCGYPACLMLLESIPGCTEGIPLQCKSIYIVRVEAAAYADWPHLRQESVIDPAGAPPSKSLSPLRMLLSVYKYICKGFVGTRPCPCSFPKSYCPTWTDEMPLILPSHILYRSSNTTSTSTHVLKFPPLTSTNTSSLTELLVPCLFGVLAFTTSVITIWQAHKAWCLRKKGMRNSVPLGKW